MIATYTTEPRRNVWSITTVTGDWSGCGWNDVFIFRGPPVPGPPVPVAPAPARLTPYQAWGAMLGLRETPPHPPRAYAAPERRPHGCRPPRAARSVRRRWRRTRVTRRRQAAALGAFMARTNVQRGTMGKEGAKA